MKFKVAPKPLTAVATAVAKVVNPKSTMAILTDFLFEVKDNELTIQGCDGENYLWGRVDIENEETDDRNGKWCLQAKIFVDLMKAMPEEDLEIEVNMEDYKIQVSHPYGHYDVVGETAESFPMPKPVTEMEGVDPESIVEMNVPGWKINRGIDLTQFAAAPESTRPQMHGICIDFKEDQTVFCATDTHKLSKFADTSFHASKTGSFILPLRTVTVVRGVFLDDEDIKGIFIPEKGVRFESETFTFESRLVKGRFPDYEKVIPKANQFNMTADRQFFTNSCRRVSVFTGDNGLIKFKIEPSQVTIKVSDTSYNTLGQEIVPCEFDGFELAIGFKDQYLLEVLGAMWGEKMHMKLADPARPVVLVPEENHPETELTILLMPMNMGEF